MIERRSLTTERDESTIFGAVVFILDPTGRVLTLQEKETKPQSGKNKGDYSVICETREKKEPAMVNVIRGLREELGIPYRELRKVLDLREARVWETSFMPQVWATVFVVRCNDASRLEGLIGSESQPDAVEMVGWKTRSELEASSLRVGVRNVLDKFGDDIFDQ